MSWSASRIDVNSPSCPTPSWRHPSPVKHQTLPLTTSYPSLLYVAARFFPAMAIPTALEIPWPRGPVVTSQPGYSISGCPAAIPSIVGAWYFLISSMVQAL